MFRSKKLVFVVVGIAAALALGSFALAAIPDNGVIHGCYKKDTGALRVYDSATNSPKACNDKEVALDWNQSNSGSNAYSLDRSNKAVPGTSTWTTVATRTIPPGKYVVSAKLYLTADGLNIPATAVSCGLGVSGGNGGSSDYTVGTVSSNGSGNVLVAPMALENNNTASVLGNGGGTVSVGCESTQPVIAHQVKITALQVESLDYQ